MRLNPLLTLIAMVSPVLATASAQDEGKRTTFWVFGPLGIESKLDQEGKTTGALMLSGLLQKSRTSNSEVRLAPALEYMVYPAGGARGLGYGARAIFSGGVSVGPSIAYVTRPRRGVAFRVALSFPFGNNAIPILPEIGLGFQF